MKNNHLFNRLPYLFIAFLLFSLSASAQVGIGTTAPTAQLTVMEDAIFNESGGNHDFRVEGNTNTNLFFIDGSADAIGFSAVPTAPFSLGVPVHTIFHPIEIGNDGNTGSQALLGYFRGPDVTIEPESGGYGYVGYRVGSAWQEWYRMYSNGFITVSARESKRNIHQVNLDSGIKNYLINNIRNLKPSLYNYINEYDEMIVGKENHYRPAFRLGLIADESPDYILDEGFSGVDTYALATLNLIGIQHNMNEIEKIKNSNVVIQDFGTNKLNTLELWVSFTEDFNNQIPIITLTGNKSYINLSIIEKTPTGFRVKASQLDNQLSFDWIAVAKVNNKNINQRESIIPNNIKDKLEVPQEIKNQIINFYNTTNANIKSK